MSIDTVTLFFALLAVVLQFALVVVLAGAFVPSVRRGIVTTLGPSALALSALVSTGAMLGSLYLSEVAKFTPCKLCWYQRIAMYPSAVLLVVAAVRGDSAVRRNVVPLASIGAVISSYHILLERFPNLESGTCDPANPCSLIWFEKFGYMTIPVMALTAFAAIVVLLTIHRSWSPSTRPITQESI
jgi:disulfide bond formation protein DsbB